LRRFSAAFRTSLAFLACPSLCVVRLEGRAFFRCSPISVRRMNSWHIQPGHGGCLKIGIVMAARKRHGFGQSENRVAGGNWRNPPKTLIDPLGGRSYNLSAVENSG
jgi:hypothetical protein